jgi:hypothetical protein
MYREGTLLVWSRSTHASLACEQQERMVADEWHDPVAAYLAGRQGEAIRAADVLFSVFGILEKDIDTRMQWRIGSIMRQEGWERKIIRENDAVSRRWVRMADGAETNESPDDLM